MSEAVLLRGLVLHHSPVSLARGSFRLLCAAKERGVLVAVFGRAIEPGDLLDCETASLLVVAATPAAPSVGNPVPERPVLL